MRILLTATSATQCLYLGKALTESLHSVETTSEFRFARYLLEQEPFDAMVICVSGDGPFDELSVEIHSERLHILKRCNQPARHEGPRHGMARLEPSTREFVDDDGAHRVPLTRREYLLLECLLREKGVPVARERLMRYVWPEKDDVEPGNLNLMVLRLRRKLQNGNAQAMIQTVNHHSYCLRVNMGATAADKFNFPQILTASPADKGDNPALH